MTAVFRLRPGRPPKLRDNDAVTEHPILMSAPMVLALKARRKLVTRRESEKWLKVRKGHLLWTRETWRPFSFRDGDPFRFEYAADGSITMESKHGHYALNYEDWYERVAYQCSDELMRLSGNGVVTYDGENYTWPSGSPNPLKWRPSIHMPRWASRFTLVATADAYRERLQDITEKQAIAEGIEHHGGTYLWRDYGLRLRDSIGCFSDPRDSFASLMNSLHGPGYWDSNPMVTVIPFDYVERP